VSQRLQLLLHPKKLAAIVAAPKRVLSRVIVMGFVFPHAKVFVVHEWADFRRYGICPAADLFLANIDLPARGQNSITNAETVQ
jgi:hypothetical protein